MIVQISKSLFLFTFHDHFQESSLVIEVESLTSNVEDNRHGIKWDDITDTMFHIWEGINLQITLGIPVLTNHRWNESIDHSVSDCSLKKIKLQDTHHRDTPIRILTVRRFIAVSPFPFPSGGVYAVSWRGGFLVGDVYSWTIVILHVVCFLLLF